LVCISRMKDNSTALNIFLEAQALLKGHFQLTSGLHSDTYMEKCLVLQYPQLTNQLCAMLANRFINDNVDVVLGPAVGAIIIAHGVAQHLNTRSIFSERENGKMVLRRGFHINPGERVLVVEDVITTGGSVLEVLDLVKQCGGELVGLGYLVDRSNGAFDPGVRAEYLLNLEAPTWAANECPLCEAGVSLQSRGSRHLK